MKLNLNDKILDFNQKPVMKDPKNSLTLKDLILMHLISNKSDNLAESVDVKKLADKISTSKKDPLTLSMSEAETLKKVVEKNNPKHADVLFAPLGELFQ